MKTNRIISKMLKQNTGRAIGDSGDAYGRNYETNAKVDFKNQAMVWGDFDTIERDGKQHLQFNPVISLYHWLDNNFEFNSKWDRKYKAHCKLNDDNDIDSFIDMLKEKDIIENYDTCFTYNLDRCDLNQDIDIKYFNDGLSDELICFIAVHGGCDIRGGWTDYRAFSCNNFHLPSFEAGGVAVVDSEYYIYLADMYTSYIELINQNTCDTIKLKDIDILNATNVYEFIVDDAIRNLNTHTIIVENGKATLWLNEQVQHESQLDLLTGELTMVNQFNKYELEYSLY